MIERSKVDTMMHPVKKEFRRKNCGFYHDEPEDFFKSQWQSSSRSWLYLFYRWFVAAFFFTSIILSMLTVDYEGQFYKYFIYLTNWGMLICFTTHLLGAVIVTIWHFAPDTADRLYNRSCCSPVHVYWALHTISLPLSLEISIIFWSVLYTPEYSNFDVTNITTHACNSLFMLLDLCIVAHPIRLLHVFLPLSLCVIYPIFSYIYQSSGGTNIFDQNAIYPVLDWDKPGPTFITLAFVVLLVTFTFLLSFFVSKLRNVIYRSCNNSNSEIDEYVSTTDYNRRNEHATVDISTVKEDQAHDNAAFSNSSETIVKL